LASRISARFEIRRLDCHRQTPAQARLQARLEIVDFLGVTIARQDDLLLAFEQRVEGVEELLLRRVLAREELDVVDQQSIHVAKAALEIIHLLRAQRVDHRAHELLRTQIQHPRGWIVGADQIARGVHQVRLAKACPTVEQQRVVRAAGVVRDLHRRCLTELVRLAFDEGIERVVRIQVVLELCGLAWCGPP